MRLLQTLRAVACLGAALPGLVAQALAQRDTLHVHGDTLSRRPATLQSITVTTTPVRRDEPQSSVEVTPVMIRRAPATDPYDLLRLSAGVEVHSQGQGPGFASNASVRGFSSDHSTDIALWVDGVPNNEPVNGHAEGYNDWNLLFPEAIAGMDVIKGPVSALFGNFALSGVVNARTIERMTGTSGWLAGGSYGRLEGVVLTGVDHERTGAVLGFRGLREDGWRPNSGYWIGQGHARLVRNLSPSTVLDAGVELYATDWDSPGFLTAQQFEDRQYGIVANTTDGGFKRRAQERLSLRVVASPTLLWRTTVFATQGRWQLFLTIPPEPGSGEGTGSQTEEEDRRYGLGLTSAATWTLARSEITAGIEGRWDHADYENWLTTDRSRDSAQTLVAAGQGYGAAFVQAISDVGHHLRLSLGARYDVRAISSTPRGEGSSSDTRGVVAPKLGALYHLHRVGDVYLNVSRGFRQTDGVVTDPRLPFITAWAYEAGLKADVRGVNANLAVFRMDVSNEQTFDPITLASSSGGQSRRQGVEVGLRSRIGKSVSVGLEAAWNDARYRHLVTEEGDTLNGARVYNTARYVGSAHVELAPDGATWHLRAMGNLVGPYAPFDEPGVELPAYGLVHLGGGVRVGQAILDLGVRNLFDRAYPELRAGGFVAPGQPRSLVASVQYLF